MGPGDRGNVDRRIFGIEVEYGVAFTFRGQRRLSPDEVARNLFRRELISLDLKCAVTTVTGMLPVHIAARILGHRSLSTTQTYLAIFQDDLVRSYRAFVDQRRATRPDAEYREPTAEEWAEFQPHFQLRKLELGTCGRPYGTPCQHEHACIRCPMLHIDPRQRQRLVEIIDNLRQRIGEATERRWLGEVQGLQISLDAAESKLTAADRISRTTTSGPRLVGLSSLLGRTETT
jgi:hypothetical protein